MKQKQLHAMNVIKNLVQVAPFITTAKTVSSWINPRKKYSDSNPLLFRLVYEYNIVK